MKIYLIILTILLICLTNLNIEKFTTYESIPNITLLQKNKTFELLDLPYCRHKFMVEYKENMDYIKNNNSEIYQDILKPWENPAFLQINLNNKIEVKLLHLIKISWQRSLFTYNGKLIGLQLHFIHIEPKTGKKIIIVFPLSFTDNIELFTNNIQNNDKSINILINKKEDIPPLIINSISFGKILDFDLCTPAKLIISQDLFFLTETSNNELLLIGKPQQFNKKLGYYIRNNLLEPNYTLKL
jgi:hypothetical protein